MNIPEISSYYPPFASPNTRPQVTNPIMQTSPSATPLSAFQKREVEYVQGYNGASLVSLAPNSSALYLDKDMNVLWVVATDQNGAKSLVKGYNIGDEYTPPKAVTMDDLMAQMQQMNDRLNKMEEANHNGQSYIKPVSASKSNGTGTTANGRNNAGYAVGKSDGSANVAG